jgi:hypothetical protein
LAQLDKIRNPKHEMPNPPPAEISNDKNSKLSFGTFGFEILILFRVSKFEFRISGLAGLWFAFVLEYMVGYHYPLDF